MRRMQATTVCIGLLLMLVAAGCGDDECPSCPKPAAAPLGLTQGIAVLNAGSTYMNLDIFGNGSMYPDLDSIKVGDSLVPSEDWTYNFVWGLTDLYYDIEFQEGGSAVNFMYNHGDTAVIRVWGMGRSSTCRLKILDYLASTANITSPASEADTIAPGAADTIFWNHINDVDYYACVVAYLLVGEGYPRVNYYFTSDTSFILTGAMYDSLATRMEFYVNPFNGPDPGIGGTNWSGDLLGGVVYSSGPFDQIEILLLQPPKSIGPMPVGPEKKLPQLSSEEIVANLYKRYAQ